MNEKKVTDVRFHFRSSGMWVTFRFSDGEEAHACLTHHDALLFMDPQKWERMFELGTELYFKPVDFHIKSSPRSQGSDREGQDR
jgi:hypothetical protein